MKCPRCNQEDWNPATSCPNCGFSGPAGPAEELAHIRYLLAELERWTEIPRTVREHLQARYTRRARELEIALGLRPPPPTPEEAQELARALARLVATRDFLLRWGPLAWRKPETALQRIGELEREIALRRARLAETETAPSLPPSLSPQASLETLRVVRDEVIPLIESGTWTDEAGARKALAELDQSIARLEIRLGLRPPPVRKEKPIPPAVPTVPSAPARPPRQPLTWDLFWRALLSERTLRTLLFVGAFLVFASAVTLVVYNWERFTPWGQVAILSTFTLFFYGLGRYVRGTMKLRNSGIALTATASLLVPVDFYAVYLSGGIFPKEAWAEVWWLTSAVCLVAYTITAWRVQAEFFGYLVGTALGNLLCASLQRAGVSSDIWSPFLGGLALGFIAAEPLWPSVVRRPFRHLALLTPLAASLLLSSIIWIPGLAAGRGDRLPLRIALALDWWLTAAVYGLMTARVLQPMFLSVACAALPLASYATLAPVFERAGIPSAWHTLPLAALTLLYLTVGFGVRRAERTRALSPPLLGWAVGLGALAAAWSLTDMAAASASHAVLAFAVALTARLWEKPRLLILTTLLSLSAALAGTSPLGPEMAEYGLPMASLALAHLAVAVLLRRAERYTPYLSGGALALGGLSLIPPLVADDRPWLLYTLGHTIALSGWAAALAHSGAHPGLNRLFPRRSTLHWITALPLPLWFGLFWTQSVRPEDAWQGLAMTGLAALLFWTSLRLARSDPTYRLPWHAASILGGVAGAALSLYHYDRLPVALNLLALSLLALAYALFFRQRGWLAVGGLVFPFGYGLLLGHLDVPPDPLATALTVPPALYLLVGTYLEQRRGAGRPFLIPLYGAAHVVAAVVFFGLGARVLSAPGSDPTLLWAAGGHLILALAYGTVAWYWGLGERAAVSIGGVALLPQMVEAFYGHVAAWLGVGAGGLIAAAFSRGRGSSAAKAALLAVADVLAERALFALRDRRPIAARAWLIYRYPLLVAGWAVSGGAIFLALVRNLLILGGGPTRENWSIVALLMMVALYGTSAWMFRRPLFLWLAASLLIAPWTLLTRRGWYIWEPPPLPRYALAWAVLAGILWLAGRALRRPYRTPPEVTAHLLLPPALLWGVADPKTSSATFGLAVAFYGAAALANHRAGRSGGKAARFLYPASFLLPIWGLYLLARFYPSLPHAHFGLLLLLFGPLLFTLARLLRLVHPADALPFYLSGYASAIAGTAVVSYDRPLLALALLWDTGLALASLLVLREPAWGYPAAACPAGALLLALAERNFPPDWRGLWLVGLAAVYLLIAWALRRQPAGSSPRLARQYATSPMVVAYTLLGLGLPIAGQEKLAAAWTFGTAVVLYGLSAFWLREPLFLFPAMGLAPVPYIVALEQTGRIAPEDWGLALWPGILVVWALGWVLERRFGDWPPFPWNAPIRWLSEAARRLVGWWPLAPYLLATLGTVTAVSWSWDDPPRRALALLLAAIAYGWALGHFRRRGWLIALLTAAQGAWWSVVDGMALERLFGPQERPAESAWRAFAFLPATLLTALVGLAVQRQWGEGPPFGSPRRGWLGWSRPFFWFLALDIIVVQTVGIFDPHPGTLISSAHAVILAALAMVWGWKTMAYGAVALGLIAVAERLLWVAAPATHFPPALALLSLAYGVAGYWMEYGRRGRAGPRFWDVLEGPLEIGGQILAATAILWALLEGMDIWGWLVRALLGYPFPTGQDILIVQMVVLVLALTGLMYLTAALVRRWYWRGYGAVALLLAAWSLEWFLVWGLREVQWYAVPAGLYLLGVGLMEWRQGRKRLGRWIDRAAILLLLGSSFYQSMTEANGWPYALLMGAEGLALVWWGSARRQRHFLYTGTLGVVLAVTGQLLRQLFTITNAWIAFGVPGLAILILVIWIERRLERLRAVSQEWRERLEQWE